MFGSTVRFLACGLSLAFLSPLLAADSPKFSDADLEFFETKVRPVLVARCHECHGPTGKAKGGLRLDSREAALQGGDTGPALVPGQPKKSLLVDAINYGELYQMPPKSRMPAEEVAVLTRWVELGAPWPSTKPPASAKAEAIDIAARKAEHWVWQPVRAVEPPAVARQDWPQSPLDRFILAKLEAAKVEPAAPADRRTLIRRASFALTGLPPTPEEVEAFVADSSSRAFEAVVDRLLESPHFGERWARHWLDLVRYAESRGHEFDPNTANAWQYRDYVIRAFNADVPYDRFVTEHLAGDLLAEPRLHPEKKFNESLLGTGFWFLGEWVHSPVDIRQDELDRHDNMLDVMGKTFLGLTVGCARCHDHKFDALSQRDYYALAGFLQSTSYRQARFDTIEQEKHVARQLAQLAADAGPGLARLVAEARRPVLDRLADYLLAARQVVLGGDAAAVAEKANVPADVLTAWVARLAAAKTTPTDPLHLWSLVAHDRTADDAAACERLVGRVTTGWRDASRVELVPRDAQVVVDYAALAPADVTQDGWSFGVAPVKAGDLQLSDDPQRPIARVFTVPAVVRDPLWNALATAPGQQLDHGALGFDRGGKTLVTPSFVVDQGPGSQGVVRFLVNGKGRCYAAVDSHATIAGPLHGGLVRPFDTQGRWQWVDHNLAAYRGHRVHLEITGEGPATLVRMVVQTSTGLRTPDEQVGAGWDAAFVPEKANSPAAVAAAYQEWFASANRAFGARQPHDARLADWLVQNDRLVTLAGPEVDRLAVLARPHLDLRAQTIVGLRAPSRLAPAMVEGSPVDENLLIRGSGRTPGALVPRRFLEAVSGDKPFAAPGSGRLELARTIVDPANPLTSRVMVNRLWHHVFGRGLVPTTDNFGVLGERPTHPELLDWLAGRFVADGWSVKKMLKTILLSTTWQMDSQADPESLRFDPKNDLWHHVPVRRLEAEAIRDQVLAVSGRLDRTPFGAPVPVHLTEFMQGRGRPGGGPLDGAGRRSIYVAVRRNFLSPMMLAFDAPIPFNSMGRRNVSNVPAQALMLMNDPFVVDQSRLWAKRVVASGGAPGERVRRMYVTAFSRPPTDRELAAALAFLDQQSAEHAVPETARATDERPWADLAHVLMNVKEFVFVR